MQLFEIFAALAEIWLFMFLLPFRYSGWQMKKSSASKAQRTAHHDLGGHMLLAGRWLLIIDLNRLSNGLVQKGNCFLMNGIMNESKPNLYPAQIKKKTRGRNLLSAHSYLRCAIEPVYGFFHFISPRETSAHHWLIREACAGFQR